MLKPFKKKTSLMYLIFNFFISQIYVTVFFFLSRFDDLEIFLWNILPIYYQQYLKDIVKILR